LTSTTPAQPQAAQMNKVAANEPPIIRLQNVSKRYGDFVAVRPLNLEVRRGEVFGFLGPNGAGKTTTLRILAGLLLPSEGEVWVGGHDMLRDPLQAKSLIGFIPDRPYLYEKLTAFEFLKFVAGLHRMTHAETAKRIEEVLTLFELIERSQSLVESFSHGMKQRLVFAAALLPSPKLLVVDEPMVGLDPRGMRLVKRVFSDICRQEGMSVFLSTHTLEDAEALCHRIGIMYRGELIAVGDMDTLRSRAGHDSGGRLEEVFFKLTEEAESERIASGDGAAKGEGDH
jgi:ABC-2 type transport system ATP-binding protein